MFMTKFTLKMDSNPFHFKFVHQQAQHVKCWKRYTTTFTVVNISEKMCSNEVTKQQTAN